LLLAVLAVLAHGAAAEVLAVFEKVKLLVIVTLQVL
jgi:hypothetical protein